MKAISAIFPFILVLLSGCVPAETDGSLDTDRDTVRLNYYCLRSDYREDARNEGLHVMDDPAAAGFRPLEKSFPYDGTRSVYTLIADFSLSAFFRDIPVSLYTVPTHCPYNVYLNGKLIFRCGTYFDDYPQRWNQVFDVQLPDYLLKYGESNRIALELFPAGRPKPIDRMTVASSQKVFFWTGLQNLFNIQLYSHAKILLCLFIAFYSIMSFIQFKRKQVRYIYFAFMNIFSALNVTNIFFKFDYLRDAFWDKLTLTAFYWIAIFLVFYSITATGTLQKRHWLKPVLMLPVLTATVFIFAEPNIDTYENYFLIFNYIITIPSLLFCFAIFIINFVRTRNNDHIIIFTGFVILFITALHDSYYFNRTQYDPFAWLNSYGYTALLLAIFIVLAKEKADMYFSMVRNAEEVSFLNKNLEALVAKRTEQLENEKEKSDRLLLNILPAAVVQELKNEGQSHPKMFSEVTVFFSDFVNFTDISSKLEPTVLIEELNVMFTAFDNIFEKFGAVRIKTIGDAYMAVCGMPEKDPNHAEKIMRAAIEVLEYLKERNGRSLLQWEIRIGVHSGNVVGGVVGIKKYIYDVFGDTVNTASRMESSSEPMRINVSDTTYNLVKQQFSFNMRGRIPVKGKGEMPMYFAERKKEF